MGGPDAPEAAVDTLVAFPPEHACRVAAVNDAEMSSEATSRMRVSGGLSTQEDMELPADM